ncbi:receptor-like protein EIX1 [Humulus lupulus]|uniref:receptor-like protein EIX1 n=1 Tax=Humulus lupulus TaxID=3486 RepID=UPI002B4131C8|nr:receptor-like protein EIX1 [Humulus lupulus]
MWVETDSFEIAKSIGSLTELTYLGLGENPIHGIIPPQLGNLSKLQVLDLSSSSQMVVDNLEWLSHCTSLMTIFISNCLLPKVDTSSLSFTNNSFLFLKSLQLSENSIHPSTITWLLNSSINLEKLVLTNNVIEGTFPNSFGHITSLEYVDLSGNELGIMGVPKSLSNLTKLKYLDLSHNNLKGTLHDLLGNLLGSTKSSLENSFNSIFVLDFSHNLLSGSIPADYWGNFQFLIVLNLAHNMLSGEIPSSISMPILQTLQLSHNNLSGTLPSSLKTCGFLRILDLGSNNLTGPIPPWIGEIPKILVLLSLKSNNFYGSIPLNLCNVSTMQILDLSSNDLSGSIPSCIKNFKAMVEDYYDPKTIIPSIPVVTTTPGVGFDDSYINTASFIWKGTQYKYDKNLGLLRIIDLSNNKFNGEIPIEVSYLSQLRQLNLSCNNFSGAIPRNIGNLNKLELLDLSRNKVFGEIPISLAEISSLNYLDLSNNRLSGRIPTSTQLQTFDPSRYTMNFGLCGPPISRSCPGDEPSDPQSPANDSDQGALKPN